MPGSGRARPHLRDGASEGTKQHAHSFRQAKDSLIPMSETRGHDPLRREPPIIDLPRTSYRADNQEPEEAPETAIEPVASTALGADAFPKSTQVEAGPNAEAAPGKPGPAAGPQGKTVETGSAGPGKGPKAAAGATDALKGAASAASKGRESVEKPKAAASPATGAAARSATPGVTGDPRPAASATAAQASSRDRRGSGFGRALAAGLLGGLVGAGLSYAATRFLPPAGPVPGLDDRLRALEQRVAALPAGAPSLEPRLVAVENGLRQAGEDAKAARTAAEAASKQAAEALNRPPLEPAADPAIREALAALEKRIEESAGRLDGSVRQANANAEAIREVASKLDSLSASTGERIAATADRIAANAKTLQGLDSTAQGLRTDVGSLQAGVATLQTRAAEGEKRLATLSTDLGRVAGDLAKLSPEAVQAGLRVVVAGRLDDLLRAGAPLGPALDALDRLGAEPESLAALRPFAEKPPADAATLAAEFGPLAAQMTTPPPTADGSVGERLRRLVGKVVTVRATGDGSGTDVPGLVARIQAALGRGALPEVAKLWDQLPEEPKRLSAGWGERLKARVAAEDAARRLVAQSLASLNAATTR